jgi:hypothetical protein
MTKDQFISTKVAVTPTIFYSTYLTLEDKPIDVTKVFIYDDSAIIEQIGFDKYQVIIGNAEYLFKNLQAAEQFLWIEFAYEELNRDESESK